MSAPGWKMISAVHPVDKSSAHHCACAHAPNAPLIRCPTNIVNNEHPKEISRTISSEPISPQILYFAPSRISTVLSQRHHGNTSPLLPLETIHASDMHTRTTPQTPGPTPRGLLRRHVQNHNRNQHPRRLNNLHESCFQPDGTMGLPRHLRRRHPILYSRRIRVLRTQPLPHHACCVRT
jgi:hypothetical protein